MIFEGEPFKTFFNDLIWQLEGVYTQAFINTFKVLFSMLVYDEVEDLVLFFLFFVFLHGCMRGSSSYNSYASNVHSHSTHGQSWYNLLIVVFLRWSLKRPGTRAYKSRGTFHTMWIKQRCVLRTKDPLLVFLV